MEAHVQSAALTAELNEDEGTKQVARRIDNAANGQPARVHTVQQVSQPLDA